MDHVVIWFGLVSISISISIIEEDCWFSLVPESSVVLPCVEDTCNHQEGNEENEHTEGKGKHIGQIGSFLIVHK